MEKDSDEPSGEDPGFEDSRVVAEDIVSKAAAIAAFGETYAEVDRLDTSPEERHRLKRASLLLDEALDLFS